MKTCAKCGEAKPIATFSPDRRHADGLSSKRHRTPLEWFLAGGRLAA